MSERPAPPSRKQRPDETRDAWLNRVRQEATEWLDKYGDWPCEECGMRPITQSHLVGCSKVQPA